MMNKKNILSLLAVLMAVCGLFRGEAQAARLRSVCRLLNAESMTVIGQGLVTGLSGTGDKSDAAKIMIQKYLDANKYNFALTDLSSKNIALVRVDAMIEPYARPGDRINLRVTSMNDATNLKDGVLDICILRFHTGGEAVIRGGGRINTGDSPTSGTIAEGGMILSSTMLNRTVVDNNGIFRLILERANYTDASTIARAINNDQRTNPAKGKVYGFTADENSTQIVARARDAKEVIVKIPDEFRNRHTDYISEVLNLDVPLESVAEVRINKQSGMVVVTGEVLVQPGFISHRGRTVSLAAPQADGGALVAPTYALDNETPRSIVDVYGPNESGKAGRRSLQSLVDTLSAMRCTPDDIMVILEKMKSTGMIQAKLVVE